MIKIAGIDLGIRKAAVAVYGINDEYEPCLLDAISFFVHPTMRGKELSTLSTMITQICDWDYAFIEEALIGNNRKYSMRISQTSGAIMAALDAAGVHTELVNVKTWKKDVIGNGNANKEMIQTWLIENYNSYAVECGEDQDKFDACCIGLFGVDVVRRTAAMGDLGLVSPETSP
jgi:Holliday junction resolvasome RuvABC endonuclease subunit